MRRRGLLLLAATLAACRPHPSGAGPEPDRVYRLSEVDRMPEMQNRSEMEAMVRRVYPEAQRRAHVEGTVMLEYRIDARGRVDPTSIRVVEATDEAFAEPAMRVAARLRFSPARLHGRAVAVTAGAPISFALR